MRKKRRSDKNNMGITMKMKTYTAKVYDEVGKLIYDRMATGHDAINARNIIWHIDDYENIDVQRDKQSVNCWGYNVFCTLDDEEVSFTVEIK